MMSVWYVAQLRTAKEIGAAEARAEQEVIKAQNQEKVQHYYSLLNEVRQSNLHPPGGRSWEDLQKLGKAVELRDPNQSPLEIRNEVATCLSRFDLRKIAICAADFNGYCLAFSPDSKRLAIGQAKGFPGSLQVQLIDVPSGKRVEHLRFQSWHTMAASGVRALTFSGDGRWLAAGTRGGELHIWDTSRTPAALTTRSAHRDCVTGLAFSPDGNLLVSCSDDKTLRLWEADSGWQALPSPSEADASLDHIAFSPDGKQLACTSRNGLRLFAVAALKAGQPVPKDRVWQGGDFRKVCFSPNGQHLAAVQDRQIVLIDAVSDLHRDRQGIFEVFQDPHLKAAHTGDINHLEFSPNGSVLVSGSTDGKVKLWEVASGRLLAAPGIAGTDNRFPSFSPDGHYLATTGNNQTILYELAGFQEQAVMAHHSRPIRALEFAPDGQTLACLATEDLNERDQRAGTLSWWDLESNRLREQIAIGGRLTPMLGLSPCLAYHPHEEVIAFSSESATEFCVWDVAHKKRLEPIHGASVSALCFAPDGQRLWAIGLSRVVNAWTWPDRTLSHWKDTRWNELAKSRSGMTCIAAGNQWIVAGSMDSSTKVFSAADATLVKELSSARPAPGNAELDPDLVLSVALTPDETLAVSGTQSGRVRVMRIPDGELVADLGGHTDQINSMAFTKDGQFLATGSSDQTVRLWKRADRTYQEILTLPLPSGAAISVRFSPDGTKLAMLVQNERAMRIWHLDRLRARLAQMNLDW
jgi:WD40 repeat protein